jgi:Ca-activated chloride channel homolog
MNFNLSWENLHFAWLLVILPIASLLFSYHKKWQKKAQEDFADSSLLDKLLIKNNDWAIQFKKGLWLAALFFLVLAIMGPQLGYEKNKVKQEGIDIVYVLDISKSMDAQDIAPSRLEKAKKIISQSISRLTGDRVSIVLFAGSAYNLLPLTNDYATANLYLSNIETDLISEQGTNYPLALSQALVSLPNNTTSDKVVFLLSDGENHQGDLTESLDEARKRNIKIYTTALGTNEGGPIPIKEEGQIIDYKKDENNQMVISKPNTDLLKQIANQTHGKYLGQESTTKILDVLHGFFSGMQKNKGKETEVLVKKHRFQWLAGVCLILLLMEMGWAFIRQKNK